MEELNLQVNNLKKVIQNKVSQIQKDKSVMVLLMWILANDNQDIINRITESRKSLGTRRYRYNLSVKGN